MSFKNSRITTSQEPDFVNELTSNSATQNTQAKQVNLSDSAAQKTESSKGEPPPKESSQESPQNVSSESDSDQFTAEHTSSSHASSVKNQTQKDKLKQPTRKLDLLGSPADELNHLKISDNFNLQNDEQIDSIDNILDDSIDNPIDDKLSESTLKTAEDHNRTSEEDESIKLDDLEEKNEENARAPNFMNDNQQYDNQHSQYAKMNSIESTTDSSFNQADSSYPFCALPANQTNEMNFYLDILRYILGKLFVDQLPDHVVNFLKIKLLVSVHLVVFVLIIGIIWFISYFVSLIYLAIDDKTKLKNRVCELQAQVSTLKSENQLIKKSQAVSKEFEQERGELQKTIDDLLNEKLRVELELGQLKNKLKQLNETNSETQCEKERLKRDLKEEMLTKSRIELSLNEKLKNLEQKCDELNGHYNDLKNRKQKGDQQIESQTKELASLNESLNQLNERLKEKGNEIEYLNRMYDELKEVKEVRTEKPASRSVDKSENTSESLSNSLDGPFVGSPGELISAHTSCCSNDSADESVVEESVVEESAVDELSAADQTDRLAREEELTRMNQLNLHELNRLKHDIEKVQREKGELKSDCEEARLKIDRLEEEMRSFEAVKSKLVKEKEDAERYTDFSKKYLREKEDELQVQMQSMREELEETKKLYLNSERYSSDYWKENQTLKNDMAILRKDNEQLRRQVADLMSEDKSQSGDLQIPELSAELMNYIRLATSPTASLTSSRPAVQTPSNHSQISDYYANSSHYQPNLSNYSTNQSLSYQPTSPTHSQRSSSRQLNNSMLSNSSMNHPNNSMPNPSSTANSSLMNTAVMNSSPGLISPARQTSPKNIHNFSYPNMPSGLAPGNIGPSFSSTASNSFTSTPLKQQPPFYNPNLQNDNPA